MPIKSTSANSPLGAASGPARKMGGRGFFPNGLIALLIVVILIGAGWWFFSNRTGDSLFQGEEGSPTASLKSSKPWQAVFLTNGQVYFGRVVKETSENVILREIYYLRVVNPPLQMSQEGEAVTEEARQQISLIKLGNELHGPKDEMKINRYHIMFTEDLRDDSRVVQAIANYLEDRAEEEAAD